MIAAAQLDIVPQAWLPIGSSSSPKTVYVTRVGEGKVWYLTAPFGAVCGESRETFLEAGVFRSLAITGMMNKLRSLENYFKVAEKEGIAPGEFMIRQADYYREALETGQTRPEPLIDHCRIELWIRLNVPDNGKPDAWSVVDSLTGGCCNSSRECEEGVEYNATAFGADELLRLLSDPRVIPSSAKLVEDEIYPPILPELNEKLAQLSLRLPVMRNAG